MSKKLRNIILSAALAAGTLAPAIASAQQTTPTSPSQTAPAREAFVGSIVVPSKAASYLNLAKISLQDAVTAAEKAVNKAGASEAELEVKNGFLVWEVTIGNQKILIDAGNGSVLRIANKSSDRDSSNQEEHGDQDESNG